MGTMTMELGGKVYIECGKTGYSAELEFKLRVTSLEITFSEAPTDRELLCCSLFWAVESLRMLLREK